MQDNIPGLPGVGEVTAKKFLAEYMDYGKSFINTDKLKGKMKENINKEKGLTVENISNDSLIAQ
jgi:DNA polymerase-1